MRTRRTPQEVLPAPARRPARGGREPPSPAHDDARARRLLASAVSGVTPSAASPPRLASWWLARALPAEIREALLGDLAESFAAMIASGRTPRAAGRWYWRETLHAPLFVARRGASPVPAALTGDGPVTTLLIDLRFALRMFTRQSGFTTVAAITLALGIGATTAIFSAVYPILFAPLPYPDADRILMIWERERAGEASNVGYATFTDLHEQSRSFSSAAAVGDWQTTLTTAAEPELLQLGLLPQPGSAPA